MNQSIQKTESTAPEGDKRENEGRRRVPPLLRQAWFGLNQAFRRRIAAMNVTPDQYTILRIVGEEGGGITQKEICGKMTSDPNTVAAVAGRMEELGLVERRTHVRDRRAVSIWLTPAGLAKLHEVRPVALALQEEVMSGLAPAERIRFLEYLERVAVRCQKALAASPARGPRIE